MTTITITELAGVNPACAGMIPLESRRSLTYSSKPRVCGDDPTTTFKPFLILL